MNLCIAPGPRHGEVRIPASKSQAHRLMIISAFSDKPALLSCDGLSNDIIATASCLNSLGAHICTSDDGSIHTSPFSDTGDSLCELHCGESGSTLRFLLPVCGALGKSCVFIREGRLPDRPLEPLLTQLRAHGMHFREEGAKLFCEGRLTGGSFTLPGNVSSQYITGLLMSLPFIDEASSLEITGTVESAAYITMTEQALALGGIDLVKTGNTYSIKGHSSCSVPEALTVESDWSNAAFFLCMGALSEKGVLVKGLNPDSAQGDKAVIEILRGYGADISYADDSFFVRRGRLTGQVIDASPVPDLVPTLAVTASVCEGVTRFVNAGRLRLKESDRLESTASLINNLGGKAEAIGDELIITGVPALSGGSVDTCNDHRIAMSAAVAVCISDGTIQVTGSECVNKSYPRFWEDFARLEGGLT